LDRLGLFGVRLAVALIRQRETPNATTLATELVRSSGVRELRDVLSTQFAERRDVLKARSALMALEGVLHERPVAGSDVVASELERLTSAAHELAELRLLNALRAGGIKLKEQETADMERLLGAEGAAPHARPGLGPETDEAEIRRALQDSIGRWQRRAESPMSSRDIAHAARVLVRTCEGMLASRVGAP
jgi:hypothetical protein